MKRFSLATVLRIRRRREDAAQASLGELNRQHSQIQRQLRGQQDRIQMARDLRRGCLSDRVDMNVLRAEAAAEMQFMKVGHGLLLELSHVHGRTEVARLELLEASRSRQVIEHLESIHRERQRQHDIRQEQRLLDDLVNSGAFKRSYFS